MNIEIIAEIGVNHNGDMQVATDLIWECKRAGANVAKFQLYDPRKRVDIDTHRWKDVLLQSRMTKRQVLQLAMECEKAGIEFMASCFDAERVGWCEQAGVKRYKIASKSIYDVELAKALVKTGKPVLLSMGFFERGRCPAILEEMEGNADRLKVLYCVSEYPTAYASLDMNLIGYSDGFSDHSPGLTASIAAMALGAKIIEKHVTLDRTKDGPDHMFSLEPDDLKELCAHRDAMEVILNVG